MSLLPSIEYHMENTFYVFLLDGTFLPYEHGEVNFDISLSMWEFYQLIKTFSVNIISIFGDDLSLCSTSISVLFSETCVRRQR